MGMEIITAGFYTTVQDEGRYGYQQFGMPVSGAMDLYSMHLANILVGNEWGTEVLEATVMAPKVRFTESNIFAVTGAEVRVSLSGMPLESSRAYLAQAGDVLEITPAQKGCRIYIAIAGGFSLPKVMGSKSTYVKGKIGGLEGRPLRAGDSLSFANPVTELPNLAYRKAPVSYLPELEGCRTIRLILGPQDNCFSQTGIETVFHGEYTVSNDSDRMGYRLSGEKVEHAPENDGNIISDPIAFGSVQVPGHGNPIIMMADRQTTGGYTKIGTVATADLPKIAQMKSGDCLRFAACNVATAQRVYRKQVAALRKLEKNLNRTEIIGQWTMGLQIDGKSYSVEIAENR